MKELKLICVVFEELLSAKALGAIKSAPALYVQTLEHPCMRFIRELRPDAVSMDDIYREAEDFDELNRRITARVIGGRDGISSVYVVFGGLRGSGLLKELTDAARRGGITVDVIPSPDFAQLAMAAAAGAGLCADSCAYTVCSANELSAIDTAQTLVIEEVDTLLRAGEVKLKLAEYYPDECSVLLCRPDADRSSYVVDALPLRLIDRPQNSKSFEASSVLIIPPCPLEARERYGMRDLIDIMRRLRAPGGCPWDAEQTHASLRSSLIEESYEVLDAIERGDVTALEEELGDLLLQVVFHTEIEEERAQFGFRDVTTGIVAKLIYRHPHVFAKLKVRDSDEVLANWERLKRSEKHQSSVADAMEAVPRSFPALMRSSKIQKKAANVGFDWSSAEEALDKVDEELHETLEAIREGDGAHVFEEIGDLLFACVNASRLAKIDPEDALGRAADKFQNRFTAMEKLIQSEGLRLEDMTLGQMDVYWERVKRGRSPADGGFQRN